MRTKSIYLWAGLTATAVIASGGVAHAAGMEIPLGEAVWSYEGTQTEEYLGYAVHYAGDLNGDTYADIVVGAPSYDEPGFPSTGRAWIFYGSVTGPSLAPDVTLIPPTMRSNGGFGTDLGWAGDVNDDTYDDLIVAMNNYSAVINQEGAVFVYYGSPTGIASSPDWMARGDSSLLQFGYGAAAAGDVNGDDIDDIIVGSAAGAWVYHGSDNGLDPDGSRPVGFPGNADWAAAGDGGSQLFGMHVGSAGDVDGDGYDDIWIADPWYDNPEQDEGKVFVWYGSDTGLGAPGTPANADWAAESNDASSYTGGEWLVPSATSVGDVDDDGYDDLLVAAAKYDAVAGQEGIAMLFYGSVNGLDPDGSRPVGTPANADWTLVGAAQDDILGYSVGHAGDFNDDGYDDFLIGVFGYDATGQNGEGATQLWLGSASGPKPGSLPSHVDCFVEGDQLGEHIGTTADGAGDVDGDGYDDFLSGAIYWDTPGGETSAGRVYLLSGAPIVFAEDFESADLWRWFDIIP